MKYSNLRKNSQACHGSAMLYVTGLIVIITILLASILQWQLNSSLNQTNLDDEEMLEAERQNVEKLIHATVRKRLLEAAPNILDLSAIKTQVETHLTQDPKQGVSGGFELSSIEWKSGPSGGWLQGASGPFTQDFSPDPSNPLFYLWHLAYGGELEYTLLLHPTSFSAASEGGSATPLTSTTSLHFREIPTSQVPFVCIDRFQANQLNFPLTIQTANSMPGTALLPYGVDVAAPTAGGFFNAANLVVPFPVEENSCLAGALVKSNPRLAVSWLQEPYTLTEENFSGDSFGQKYFKKSQIFRFDGQKITEWTENTTAQWPDGNWTSAISVQKRYGAKRVVIDMSHLLGQHQIYIDCTNPLAKQRGVALIGSGSLIHEPDSVISNGALFLEGEQTRTSLIAGSHYGGVVFTDPSNKAVIPAKPIWRVYLVTPVRPPFTQNIGNLNIAGTEVALDQPCLNYDTIALTGMMNINSNPRLTFRYDKDDVLQFRFTSGISSFDVYTKPTTGSSDTKLGTFATTSPLSGNITYTITYHRAQNTLSCKIQNDRFWIGLDSVQPRFEFNKVFWNRPLGASATMAAVARSGGSGFYRHSSVNEVRILGGLLAGQVVTGDLLQMTLEPSTSADLSEQMRLADRFLLFAP